MLRRRRTGTRSWWASLGIVGSYLLACLGLAPPMAVSVAAAQSGVAMDGPSLSKSKPKPKPRHHDRHGHHDDNHDDDKDKGKGKDKDKDKDKGWGGGKNSVLKAVPTFQLEGAVLSAPGARQVASVAIPRPAVALREGRLVTDAGLPLPAAAQREFLVFLSGATAEQGSTLVDVLTSRENGRALREARVLVSRLQELRVDVHKLPAAVQAYNALIDASSEAFVRSPPVELLGIQAALSGVIAEIAETSSPRE